MTLLIAITTRFATRTRGRVTTTSNHTTVVSHCSDQLLGYELSDAWGEVGIGENAEACLTGLMYDPLFLKFPSGPNRFLFSFPAVQISGSHLFTFDHSSPFYSSRLTPCIVSTSQDTLLSGLTYPERRLSRISPLFTNPFYSPSLPLLSSPTNDEPSAPSTPTGRKWTRVLSVDLASITLFDPTPFTLGTVHSHRKRGRHIYSAGTQACTGHGFFKECSVRLRPHADDNIMRPCLALPPCHFTREHVLTQSTLHASPRQRHFG